MSNAAWTKIMDRFDILKHDFNRGPFYITASDIWKTTGEFKTSTSREPRLLCRHETRDKRPDIFKEHNLFIMPIENGTYAIIKGDGYIDIPSIDTPPIPFKSKLTFTLSSPLYGNSEMQHLDYAYACGLVQHFVGDNSLMLTIRGRKRTNTFSFFVGNQEIVQKGVQTEVDAGYEGQNKVVLIEAKNTKTSNVMARQLYYPYRLWTEVTGKKVTSLFFEKRNNEYCFWEYHLQDESQFNSFELVNSCKYIIQ
ncbi:hypothetical protein U8V72_22450 [Priestia filamentosa]|uniref:type II restriction enzyme n=1 Tax=Priestia filamentosa TaxID=1402861 RepID=UPI00397C40EB